MRTSLAPYQKTGAALREDARALGIDPDAFPDETDLLAAVKAERLRRRQEELRPFAEEYNAFRERVPSIGDEWHNL